MSITIFTGFTLAFQMLPWFLFFSSEGIHINYSWVKTTDVFNCNIKSSHVRVNSFRWTLNSNTLVFKYFASTPLEMPHMKVYLYWTAEQVRCRKVHVSLCISWQLILISSAYTDKATDTAFRQAELMTHAVLRRR